MYWYILIYWYIDILIYIDIESESKGGPRPGEEKRNYEVDIECKSKSEIDTEGKSWMIELT